MEERTAYAFSRSYDNTTCEVDRYTFSPAIAFEFYDQHSADNGESTHSGQNYLRIDFTLLGRFECEFLDHTYSYRGENEITILATPSSENWLLSAGYPIGEYQGCALAVRLDKLTKEDDILFDRFGVRICKLIKELNVIQHWKKIISPHLTNLFHEIYEEHKTGNRGMIFLRVLEILIVISKNHDCVITGSPKSEFFPSEQVKKVKRIHEHIAKHYMKSISFENLTREYRIGYPTFNKIFKAMYGDSPYQYFKKLRINLAAQQMLKSESSIMEIAASVGYSNPSKFSNAFESVMGVLPHTFKKQN